MQKVQRQAKFTTPVVKRTVIHDDSMWLCVGKREIRPINS